MTKPFLKHGLSHKGMRARSNVHCAMCAPLVEGTPFFGKDDINLNGLFSREQYIHLNLIHRRNARNVY